MPKPLAGEDRSGAIANQSFQSGPIPGGDPDFGVEGETAAVVPPEHELRSLLRQHRAALEQLPHPPPSLPLDPRDGGLVQKSRVKPEALLFRAEEPVIAELLFSRYWLIHLRSRLALMPCSSAIRATEIPGCRQASTSSRLASGSYRQRPLLRCPTTSDRDKRLLFSIISVHLVIRGHYLLRFQSDGIDVVNRALTNNGL